MAFVLLCLLALPLGGAGATETPKRGGILTFVVVAEPPSFDGHREPSFALIHPIAPFYSTRIRVNPENPASPTDFVGDLTLDVPVPTDDGTTYTFTLRQNATFWDGQPVTAHDVVTTFNKIIFPPEGVLSAQKAFFSFIYFIYSAQKLAQDMHWYEKHILGSGPFIFVQHQPGAFIEGRRNPNYYHAGKSYLDGFRATFAEQQAVREQAIRHRQALIEFRGFPPRSRDPLGELPGPRAGRAI